MGAAETDWGDETMSEVTAEQLAKLPKWARDHVARLERKLASERAKSGHLEFPAVEYGEWVGDKVYAQFGHCAHYTELPEDSTAVFPTEGGHVTIQVRRTGELEVMGDSALSIVPQVSNVVRLKVVPR